MTKTIRGVKFYACDYDYKKELEFLLYFTDFSLNTCHDLICVIHKCLGDYTISSDKIFIENIHQHTKSLHDFCVKNKLSFTIKHNIDSMYSSIYNQVCLKHIDYSFEIKHKE